MLEHVDGLKAVLQSLDGKPAHLVDHSYSAFLCLPFTLILNLHLNQELGQSVVEHQRWAFPFDFIADMDSPVVYKWHRNSLIFLPVHFHIRLFCTVIQADSAVCAPLNEHRRVVKRSVE